MDKNTLMIEAGFNRAPCDIPIGVDQVAEVAMGHIAELEARQRELEKTLQEVREVRNVLTAVLLRGPEPPTTQEQKA